MQFELSIHAKDVMTIRNILEEWVISTINDPSVKVIVNEQEVHYFSTISENEKRCLKVVVNPGRSLVITAYFDRNMRKRGCR